MAGVKIGHDQLNPKEKAAYLLFEKAFADEANIIDISTIDKSVDIMKVLQTAIGDHPKTIYFNKSEIRITSSVFGVRQIHLSGTRAPAQARRIKQELDAAVLKAVSFIQSMNPLSEYDKLICIYEYLQDHVRYDEEELKALSRGTSINPYASSAYGALVKGLAVCDGISAAFGILAQEFGFDSTIVCGKAAFRTTDFSSHAWNIVRVGKQYYQADVTWDINQKSLIGEYSYEYFCVEDDDISLDHEWDISTTPACRGQELSFYRHSGCFVNNLTQLEELFNRISRSRAVIVRAKIAGGTAVPEPEDLYIAEKLSDAASAVRSYESIDYSWNKNQRCFFAKFL